MRWLIELIKRLFGAVVSVAKNAVGKLVEVVKWFLETVKKTPGAVGGFLKMSFTWAKNDKLRLIMMAVSLVLTALISSCFLYFGYRLAISVFLGLTVILFIFLLTIHLDWYIAAFLAKYDFIFTNVPEGYFKEVVRFGGHRKTLLSKKGYKISDKKSDDGKVDIGDIVPLEQGEAPETTLPGGLRIVGWPFIDTIYRGEMKFLKSLPSGDTKIYDVVNVDKFYARRDYPYALIFVKCEDKNNLPLLGHATLLAHVVNPVKSLFITSNFYDTMIGLILPVVRKRLEKFTFDEIKEKPDLDKLMWEEINKVQPAGLIGTEDDINVLEELRSRYGVGIVALRVVNVDPPEEYRNLTLTKWKAEREADAANAIARKQAEETEGRVIEAVAIANGLTREGLKEILVSSPDLKGLPADMGGFKEDFANARDLLKRDRAGEGLEDIRVGSVDGTPLKTGVAEIAAMIGLWKSKGSRRKNKGNSGGGKGGKRKKPEDMDDDEIDDDVGWTS